MNKVGKGCLIAAGVVTGGVAALFLALNMYVQSPTTQEALVQRLSDVIGLPVKIERTSFTPWSGLQMSGVSVANATDDSQFLTVQNFNASIAWLPLLQRKFVVSEAVIDTPHLVWQQNKNAAWELPTENQPEKIEPQPKPAVSGSSQLAATPEPTASSEIVKPESEPQKSGGEPIGKQIALDLQVHEFHIVNGDCQFLDRKGRPLVTMSGVDVKVPTASAQHVEGTIFFQESSIRDRVHPEHLRGNFTWNDGVLEFHSITADLANGQLSGAFRIEPEQPTVPYSATFEFANVDLDQLITDAGGPVDQIYGSLSGNLALHGETRDRASTTGSGQIVIANGEVRQYPLFQMVGRALRIDELVHLELQTATARFHIADEKIWIDALNLESKNLQIAAKGTAGFDGKLHLKATLTIDDTIYNRLPRFVKESFSAAPVANRHLLKFVITGTTENPRTDLGEKVIGRKLIREGRDLLHMLFGKPKSK